MPLRLLFVADPVDTFAVDKDTTFAIMLEAQRRGHAIFEAWVPGLSLEGGRPFARAASLKVRRAERPGHFERGAWESSPVDSFDAVFMRTNPPMDAAYVTALWLLDLVDRAHTIIVNEPRGILAANEKLYAARFRAFTPETLVTTDIAEVLRFFAETGGDIILKPLDGHAGTGILRAQKGDRNVRSMIELLTGDGRRWVMAQRYLPEARAGDKRILLVEGEPVGAMNRVPAGDDNRGNIRAGATVHPSKLTERERQMCEALKPVLLSDGLIFVGLDVIGERLTEINVTSPTGAQQIARFDGTCPEGVLLDAVERRRAALGWPVGWLGPSGVGQ